MDWPETNSCKLERLVDRVAKLEDALDAVRSECLDAVAHPEDHDIWTKKEEEQS